MKTAHETLEQIIVDALDQNASDIHIDPRSSEIMVRFRIDGILTRYRGLPQSIHQELIARIKILAGLRTDIHSSSHDGRFRVSESEGNSLDGNVHSGTDIRVSIVPTHYGENAVLRLLPLDRSGMSIDALGLSDHDNAYVKKVVSQPHGMILVTGPTGSGKTSTQYSLISHVDPESRSVVTLEDPVEYTLPGVRQVQVNEKHGLSFSLGLRALLRQDPDVIMVGEIRDGETARIAVNAALTGHLLISTLHTNSAVDSIPRLIDMGAEPYLIASTLSLVIGQRLVRKSCTSCRGGGCDLCRQTGYSGRCSISEILPIDEKIRSYIVRRLPREDIVKYARSIGMRTMLDHGLEMVDMCVTTKEEIIRVLHHEYEYT